MTPPFPPRFPLWLVVYPAGGPAVLVTPLGRFVPVFSDESVGRGFVSHAPGLQLLLFPDGPSLAHRLDILTGRDITGIVIDPVSPNVTILNWVDFGEAMRSLRA